MTALSPLKALEEKWRKDADTKNMRAMDKSVDDQQRAIAAGECYGLNDAADELSAVRETVEQELAQVEASWRCFHCGDVFTDKHEAREHFGKWATAEPACRLSSEDVTRLRELEDQNDALTRANNVLSNDSRLWYEAESERVRRIGRREWWQELDSMQGRIEAAEAEVERLRAAFASACAIAEREHFDGCDTCSSTQCDDSKNLMLELAALAPSTPETRGDEQC